VQNFTFIAFKRTSSDVDSLSSSVSILLSPVGAASNYAMHLLVFSVFALFESFLDLLVATIHNMVGLACEKIVSLFKQVQIGRLLNVQKQDVFVDCLDFTYTMLEGTWL
jgi:hypothetical protein